MKSRSIVIAVLLATAGTGALAQDADPLRNAAQKALLSNPDLSARANALRAATHAVDVARGPLLPRVDVDGVLGRTRDRITTRSPQTDTFTRTGIALSASQLIWDGLGTISDVRRSGHERLARQFELRDATEQTVLEAVRATYDVLRFRRLVELAEDSYVRHKLAHLQLDSRYQAGVGRGADVDQTGARLALADSNLTTEKANLHDVMARYQRIVGEAPPANIASPAPLSRELPASAAEATDLALMRSPAISASIEALRASRALASAAAARFQPRLEARVRSGAGRNFDGVPDQKRDTSGELALYWNLFNGGADVARVRQQADLVNQAADLRDRACRDARQTASIAYNDARKLAEQLGYLDNNSAAIEKARDAYRQQFRINQRSLIDVLNAENELYAARRAQANAQYDLAIAYARTHASLQQLSRNLGLTPAQTGLDTGETADWQQGEDAPTRCPVEVLTVTGTDRTDLDARAARLQKEESESRTTPTAPAGAPLVPPPAPRESPGAAPAPRPKATPQRSNAEPRRKLQSSKRSGDKSGIRLAAKTR